ncbi:phosphate starvation-inducible protein PhoH [Candidatus Kryptobacter tengchongensis]|uniref:PhoH-like protein n=1 Tax=Kryptobacter tengchongensis TaxID=1643429 RepID=A0A916LKA3_KRYT1|nr:PhoH family protein [Candidatus Kryptobacter tengchongensis]CUT04140.1 phosphate starvation-inducible protein PhoH [Candidatus Kryptobacter tengchongensis]CUU04683.1 phosphate starvation-inducible protein PhoH [Candidatus Kryptobacter tengchongensis]
MVERKIKLSGVNTLALLGYNDIYLHLIEKKFDAGITVRGDNLILKGEKDEVEKIERVFKELIFILNKNGHLTENDVNIVIDLVKLDSEDLSTTHKKKKHVEDEFDSTILFTKNGPIKAKTPGQLEYYRQVKKNDIVFVIGPAGTGKTYLAVAMAVASLKNHEVNKIILCRPAVEAGENLGFLPGDLREKIDPYLRPLYDALDDMLPADKLKSYFDKRIIEIIPLAYMRGRTLSNAFVILDEAQNATSLQMKMFLTRLGVNSKAIITGDITQIDLPSRTTSGLVEIQEILKGIEGIAFVYLDKNDVVRHRLVKDIIEAYDRYNAMNGKSNEKKDQSNE